MDSHVFRTQCKVRECSQCQGDTEFYCKTCKHDLCLLCKENYVLDLDTLHHEVVIYREKNDHISKQEPCVRHPNRFYKMYCHSCNLSICFQCTGHRKHKLLDIRTAYKTKRKQQREIIHSIRSETICSNYFLLSGIKADIKTCHPKIVNHQSKMATKVQRLKSLIDKVICDILDYMTHRLPKMKKKINRHLASIEKNEYTFEQSANRPLKYLLFLKKTNAQMMKDTPNLPQHTLLSQTEEVNMEDVIKLLKEIQIIETGKRQIKNDYLLKLMSTPVLNKSVTVTDVRGVWHISCLKSDQIWISDMYNNLILTNTAGDTLHRLSDRSNGWGGHTVNSAGDLIYIDRNDNINILSKVNRTRTTLFKKSKPWLPRCVYCSLSNGDFLVGMLNTERWSGKVTRFNDTGQHIQTIQHSKRGQELYGAPIYITENRNGDVIVSDFWRGVVVTDRLGRYRFSYTGPPTGSQLYSRGICTDALSHILVCDDNCHTIQMIDQAGSFLSLIHTQQQGIYTPQSLSYDDKTHLLFVGSYDINRVCAYRYIERNDYVSGSFCE
ncbi:uncharacterized protein LOC133176065 [Saccostrea echinata]|uniref:uncharacterized protein LOC133176065 n=1 Tax=Saccostrea echinata TaxID=191078 RepID=UPI002A7EED71|nr:uncharacterized protein LOC133176065 [Saccostrea echinata]